MRIGLVLNVLDEEYQISVYKGIKKRALEQNVDLICFQLENTGFTPESFISKLPDKDYFNVDGIILLTSVLVDNNEINEREDVEKVFGNIPVVSVGQKIEGIPSFLVKTDDSMAEMVRHLVFDHNYKNFLYLAGAKNHHDAIIREKHFVESVDFYKKEKPDLNYFIKRGNFTEASAINEMNDYFNEHKNADLDCVVCANDNMAIGVYKFFKMNRDNPLVKKCAVTGFDDIAQGKFEIPSLTTIHQPLDELGSNALDTLLAMLKNEKYELINYSDSSLVLRNSCGCKKNENDVNSDNYMDEMQSNYVRSEQMLRLVTHIGQDLNYVETTSGLKYLVNMIMAQLDVKNFCVLSFENQNQDLSDLNLEVVKPVFVRRNGVFYYEFNGNKKTSLGAFYKQLMDYDDIKPKTQAFKFLYSGNEIIGGVFYDSSDYTLPYLCLIAINIAQTLNRIAVSDERKKNYQYLEKEIEERTKELVEANNRRMEVEAEVLRISELERQRFSNDLHDDICQRLAGISMLCRSYSNQANPIKKEEMVELAELISDTLQTTRQYAHNSYPVELENLGMNHSISNLCASFEKQSGITCDYIWNLKDDSVFSKTEKLNIFRIIQEALHNVMKHAKATSVEVSLNSLKGKVIVKIADDGCGLNIFSKDEDKGLGLNSMQYRANQIDAGFRIYANEPTGTCVEIELKVSDKN